MERIKYGVFAYNFEHPKTQDGLINLFFNGFIPKCILAADPVKLNFYKSKVRIEPKDLVCVHPSKIAEKLGIPYHVVKHNSKECIEIIKKYDLDVGIILGARILSHDVIESFKIGILNIHPGLLPDNRGLDCIKWAIIMNIKQGVTAHLIDKKIDAGSLIIQDTINVYQDDTLLDIHLRLQNKEQILMIDSLKMIGTDTRFHILCGGDYHSSVPVDLEQDLLDKFEEYKQKYMVV